MTKREKMLKQKRRAERERLKQEQKAKAEKRKKIKQYSYRAAIVALCAAFSFWVFG